MKRTIIRLTVAALVALGLGLGIAPKVDASICVRAGVEPNGVLVCLPL